MPSWNRRMSRSPRKTDKSEKKTLDKTADCGIILSADAGIAHPVERHLAKVEVASSSLVARSIQACRFRDGPVFCYPRVWWNWQTRWI